jgi:tetratricopeptide (TPR) repeat protein
MAVGRLFMAKIYILCYFTGEQPGSLRLGYSSCGRGEGNMKTAENQTISRVSLDEETYLRYGDEMMFRGQFDEAVQQYDRALEIQADSAKAWHAKANALEALGKYEEALTCYDQALNCDEGDSECWFNKGVTLKKLGRNKDGAACIDTGVHIAMGL